MDSRRSGSANGPDDPWVGRVIADRYALEQRLGTGTLGFVYQARHTTLDRRVTLELLDAELVDREAVRECFKSAMKQLARVRHRNVVELESSGVDADGALYVVTKHVAAPRLDEIIEREGQLSWPRARALALQLVAALDAAHQRGVMHGGLRPRACYVVAAASGPEQLVVTDFALAGVAMETRVAADAKGATTRLAGDPRYLALEQLVTGKGSVAADVHAVGAVLYHVLTGTPPCSEVNPFHALQQRRGRAVIPPRTIEPSVPLAVEAVLLRALATEPEQRHSTMRELATALEAVPATAVVIMPIGGDAEAPPPQQPALTPRAPDPAPVPGPMPVVVRAPAFVSRPEPEDIVLPTQLLPAQTNLADAEDDATMMMAKPWSQGLPVVAEATTVLGPSSRPRGIGPEKTSLLGVEPLLAADEVSSTMAFARTPGSPPTERLTNWAEPAPLTTEPLAPPTAVVTPRIPGPSVVYAAPSSPAAVPPLGPIVARPVAHAQPQATMLTSASPPPVVTVVGRMWLLVLGAIVLVAAVGALVGLALARASATDRAAPHAGSPSPTTAAPRSQP